MRKLTTIVSFTVCLTWLLGGCMGGSEDPKELLSQAVSSIVGQDDFTFVGSTSKHISGGSLEKAYTFMGNVSGHNDIYIEPLETASDSNFGLHANSGMLHYSKVNKQWVINGNSDDRKQLHPLNSLNPLLHAEYLNREAEAVTIEAEQSTSAITILQARIDGERLLTSFKEQVRAEHEEVIAAAQQELARHSENAALQEELADYIAQAEQRLKDILSSLRIEADYRLAVVNRSRQLQTMEVATRLQYDFEGESREDKINTVYQFE